MENDLSVAFTDFWQVNSSVFWIESDLKESTVCVLDEIWRMDVDRVADISPLVLVTAKSYSTSPVPSKRED